MVSTVHLGLLLRDAAGDEFRYLSEYVAGRLAGGSVPFHGPCGGGKLVDRTIKFTRRCNVI